MDMVLVTSCLRSTSSPPVQHHHSGPHEEVEECAFVGNTRHFDNDRLGWLTVLGRHENRHRQASDNRFRLPLWSRCDRVHVCPELIIYCWTFGEHSQAPMQNSVVDNKECFFLKLLGPCVRLATRPQVLYRRHHLQKRSWPLVFCIHFLFCQPVSCGVYDDVNGPTGFMWSPR